MKQAARILLAAGFFGTATILSSCSGGGSGGGGMFVQSCTLGCSNGEGGSQVSCGIVNTYQNQDISVSFSQPVSALSLSVNNSMQVIDTVTGAIPPGTRLVDPNNPYRAIFRPKLAFDSQGNPSFGFGDDSSYQIRIPGTAQGDAGPYIESDQGQLNQSRMLCTITTDQGLIDPVPGAPSVDILVTVNGVPNPVNVDDPTACLASDPNCNFPQPAGTVIPTEGGRLIDVATSSQIRMIFNDLMNIGTIVLPSTGQAPFITVKTDADGDPSTTADQVALGGTYQFQIDQSNLKTILVFTPSGGLPSAGSGPQKRLVVIDIPPAVKDLAGNSVANLGKREFAPQVINFGDVTIPAGGEQFTSTLNMDAARSGADWGESVAGRLQPGAGGGSGRLGDLTVPANATYTIYTGPRQATGRFKFLSNPRNVEAVTFSIDDQGHHFTINRTATANVVTGDSVADTIARAIRFLEDPANQVLFPELALFTYEIENNDTLVLTSVAAGTAGDGARLSAYPDNVVEVVGGTTFQVSSPSPLDLNPPPGGGISLNYYAGNVAGGIDAAIFGPTNIALDPNIIPAETNGFLTNSATPPTYINVDDGVLEFSKIDLGMNSTLRFVGSNIPRLFARGEIRFADTALITVAGADQAGHGSDGPRGQRGALGGPGGGAGGNGGDRPDTSSSVTFPLLSTGSQANFPIDNNGVINPGGIPDGQDGEGVGGAFGYGLAAATGLGSGQGGVKWPPVFPTETNVYGDLSMTSTNCDSAQLGGPGSGGAFATDGEVGSAVSSPSVPVGPVAFTPADTAAGDSAQVALENPLTPGPKRALTPSLGYLRGGSGGGGAGAHIFDTGTTGTGGNCFAPALIDVYRSHSGGGGGGGGGAIQVVAGRLAELDGRIDATGGSGGSVLPNWPGGTQLFGSSAQPGGGGAGGAILIQSRRVDLSPLPSRLLVSGGVGGLGPVVTGATGVSVGGNGGTGLVRIDDDSGATTATSAAAAVTPTDPGDPTSTGWLSVASSWADQTAPIEAYSGAQSCWYVVAGSFFALTFDGDAVNDPGWDMDLYLQEGPSIQLRSYRNSTTTFGVTPEQNWGNLIDDGTLMPGETGAPIIVRFQGAKTTGTITDPCNLVFGPGGNATGLTPWVMHPEELNSFSPAPDVIRWQIVFDRSHPDAGLIHGVTNVRVHATPD